MDYKAIEQKWNKKWEEDKLHAFDRAKSDKKYYVLEMFSYPSGANLHLGHWYNYGPTDSFARFKRMQGYEVFQPMGFDAFGAPGIGRSAGVDRRLSPRGGGCRGRGAAGDSGAPHRGARF